MKLQKFGNFTIKCIFEESYDLHLGKAFRLVCRRPIISPKSPFNDQSQTSPFSIFIPLILMLIPLTLISNFNSLPLYCFDLWRPHLKFLPSSQISIKKKIIIMSSIVTEAWQGYLLQLQKNPLRTKVSFIIALDQSD